MWQTSLANRDAELRRLHGLLLESRAYFFAHAAALARRYAAHFGIDAEPLLDYWRSLRYVLDERVERGLLHFFELAARLGEAAERSSLPYANGAPGTR